MNRRKTLALIGGGFTFGGLYGVNSLTQPALAVENIESQDELTIGQDDIDNLAFEFTSFELTMTGVGSDLPVEVTLQGKLTDENSYEDLETNTIDLSKSEYNNENFAEDVEQFDLTSLNLNDTGEKEINFKISINHDDITDEIEHEITSNLKVVENVIRDWYDLDNIRNDVRGDYLLVNDLDENMNGYDELAGPEANGGAGWEPIELFEGNLDGGGYEIAGLTIDRSDNFNGLIGFGLSGAYLSNLTLTNVDISAGHNSGGFVGRSDNIKIENCHVVGEVVGGRVSGLFTGDTYEETEIINCSANGVLTLNDEQVGTSEGGGLFIGQMNGGYISQCSVDGELKGSLDFGCGGFVGIMESDSIIENSTADVSVKPVETVYIGNFVGQMNDDFPQIKSCLVKGNVDVDANMEWVGGFIGQMNGGIITESGSTADVVGGNRTGGFVGNTETTDDNTEITNCWTHSSVKGENNVGGFGGVVSSFGATIKSCYSVTPSLTWSLGGGIFISTNGDVENSYADDSTILNGDDIEGNNATLLSTNEMQGDSAETNMDGFDFEDVWRTVTGDYPELQWQE